MTIDGVKVRIDSTSEAQSNGHNRLRISHSVQLAAEAAATTPPDSQQKRDTQSSCGGRLCGRTSLSPLIPALALRRARGCFVRARRRAQPSSMRRQRREDLDRGASPRQLGGAISADAADVTQIKPISHLRSSASSADGLFGHHSFSFTALSKACTPPAISATAWRPSSGRGAFLFQAQRVIRMDSGHRPGARRSREHCASRE